MTTNIIDQYGLIDAQIKELEAIKATLKAELIARGIGTYEGESFFAEVQEYDRENISAPLVRKLSDEAFVRSVTTIQHIKAVVVKQLEVA
jgi:tetrahydromethanopterin S-methyltransferase subunit A